MPYEYFDVTAEIGIRAKGRSPEAVFVEGAKALFALMVDISQVSARRGIHVQAASESLDLLYVHWLNRLIIEKDKGNVCCDFDCHITVHESACSLEAVARGERFDPARHESRLDVKAVTYSNLSFVGEGDEYVATCVLDV